MSEEIHKKKTEECGYNRVLLEKLLGLAELQGVKTLYLYSMDRLADSYEGQLAAYRRVRKLGLDIVTVDGSHKMFEEAGPEKVASKPDFSLQI